MMRFLIDTNLPPGLATWLRTQGYEGYHTSELGLEAAKDHGIWDRAKADTFIIVTKDEDFVLLKTRDPSGPNIVWVRIGNAVRRVLFQRLISAWPAIMAKLEAGEPVVEVR